MQYMTIRGEVARFFRPRELYLRNGTELRHIVVSSRLQMAGAAVVGLASVGLIGAGVQAATGVSAAGLALSSTSAQYAQVAKMEAKVAALQAQVEDIRKGARAHAALIDQRDALLAAVIAGKGDANKLAALELPDVPQAKDKLAGDVRAPLSAAERRQAALAAAAQQAFDAKLAKAESTIGHLGLGSGRFHKVSGAMGGPYEPVDDKTTTATTDRNFRSLFQSWKKLDQLQQNVVAIPSIKPVDTMSYTSNFGVRSDPFNGRRAMHAGVDIPGAHGTNIMATADGVVNRAGGVSGYGNLVEIDHGRGIMTRYGHLSSFVVVAGQHVTRGQVIGHMGSTGRSTGTHLHYEVRIDGAAVNPVPFLESTDYLTALQKSASSAKVARGGPESAD